MGAACHQRRYHAPGIACLLIGLSGLLITPSCRAPTPLKPKPYPPLIVPPEDRHIRIRLLQGLGEVPLAIDGPYRIEDRLGRVLSDSVTGLEESSVRLERGPIQQFRVGSAGYQTKDLYVVPSYDGGIILDGQRYRGYLRFARTAQTMVVTNILDVEDYLRGVLAAEMPPNFHLEAFKAQAIAARTYALVQHKRYGQNRSWDVLPDERSQVYVGVAGETDRAVQAVEQTRDLVLTWEAPNGPKMFATYYSSTCGGWTQDAVNVGLERESIGPLAGGVQCPYCRHSRYHTWPPVKILFVELTQILIEHDPRFKKLGRVRHLEIIEQDPHGWAIRLQLHGTTGGRMKIGAYDLRRAIGSRRLKSTNFRVVNKMDGVVFENGRGFGHGVGMCQYGADGLAKRGFSAFAILRFYYPGSSITRLPPLEDVSVVRR